MIIGIDKGSRSRKYVIAAQNMGVSHKLVDCSSSDIIRQLEGVDALIWHWTHDSYIDKNVAFHIIKSAEMMGKKVYPNAATCWMFDNKISEKYLLEAVNAPFIESKVFFEFQSAIAWIKRQQFPIVYKLPQGAGSSNVRLIENVEEAVKICKAHFSFWRKPDIDMQLFYAKKGTYLKILREIFQSDLSRYGVNNRGCLLLQKFIPGNAYDIRVTIIGERGLIFRRHVREHDFRASGSEKIDYEVSKQDLRAIPIARRISERIGSQTMTYDFIYDKSELKIVEMSYGFSAKAVYDAPGWYDADMAFHVEHTDVHKLVISELMK